MVRIAVVGLGYWGPNLARAFQRVERCDLVACCDLDERRLAAASRLHPHARMTTDFQAVLDSRETDAVAIATPPRTHYLLVKRALLAGKHVLVEKPLAMTSGQCQELADIAASRGLVLMVGHTFLYNPALLKVRELATPDYLGNILYLYSHRVNLGRVQTDINALWSIAPHDISIALYLLGGMPLEVSARGASYLTPHIEDVVFVSLLFPRGVIAHIHVSWIDPSKVRRVTVVGSRRMIVYDDLADEGKVKVYDKGVLRSTAEEGQLYGEFHYRLHSGDIYAPRIEMSEPLANECSHFIQCILQGKRPRSDGENGLQVVRVLEAAQQSLERRGVPVELRQGVGFAPAGSPGDRV